MAKNRGSRNLCPDAVAQQKKQNPQRLHKKLSQQVIPYLPPMTSEFLYVVQAPRFIRGINPKSKIENPLFPRIYPWGRL
ncbi:MAG: hypothetical protein EAZ19_08155 [Oscillatoriales cyanobacterium]|nr:MAG: hypothetical protein EAZ94_21860 [Oscillatoriales cyanobacterium]TAE20557.1 MAG: hypothetical protein EAZ93_23305 [Oscillatoriales cyanobacterium]TAG50897.1 MAG: hypothetical protein EAZ28_31975 [Oscillatoriales cyanobacterium]TAG96768.1 MAG: hypothetical protein EAZ19_08155 [Oscillatoriales cyanobacterium]